MAYKISLAPTDVPGFNSTTTFSNSSDAETETTSFGNRFEMAFSIRGGHD